MSYKVIFKWFLLVLGRRCLGVAKVQTEVECQYFLVLELLSKRYRAC